MNYSSKIDNITAKEWGLNIQLAYLFSWVYSVSSWADKIMIENEVYYFASRTKAINDMPLLTDKPDTIYRYYKELESMDLIVLKKIEGKDFIALTNKAKQWDGFGKESDHSEKNPRKSGKKSESKSEKNPTYYTTSIDHPTKLPTEVIPNLPFKSENFLNAWRGWVEFRKQKKQKLTPKSIELQLRDLGVVTEHEAILMIEQSIKNGWTGIFPIKNKQHGQRGFDAAAAVSAIYGNK